MYEFLTCHEARQGEQIPVERLPRIVPIIGNPLQYARNVLDVTANRVRAAHGWNRGDLSVIGGREHQTEAKQSLGVATADALLSQGSQPAWWSREGCCPAGACAA